MAGVCINLTEKEMTVTSQFYLFILHFYVTLALKGQEVPNIISVK